MARTSEVEPPHNRLAPLLAAAALVMLLMMLIKPASAFPVQGLLGAGGLWALFTLSLLLPVAGAGFGVLPSRSPAGTFLFVACIIWGALWLWRLGAAPVPSMGRDLALTMLLSVAALLTFFLISSYYPRRAEGPLFEHPLRFQFGLITIILGGMAFFGIYQVFGPEWAPRTFRAMHRSVLELPESDPLREGLLHATGVARRASGTIGAANIFASLCVAGAIGAAACAVAIGRNGLRLLYVFLAVGCVFALVLSGSRGGLLGLLVGAGAFILLSLARILKVRTTVIIACCGGVLLAALIIGLIVTIQQGSGDGRWLGGSGIAMRLSYWQTAWAIWSDNLLFGQGPGAFQVLYPQHRIPGSDETKHSHSWFFEFGTSIGLFGVLIFLLILGFVGLLTAGAFQALRKQGDRQGFLLLAGVASAAIGVLAHGLLEYTLSFREAALLCFALLGIAAGSSEWILNAHDDHSASARKPRPQAALLPAGFSALVLLSLYTIGYRPLSAWIEREEADAILHEGGDPLRALAATRRAIAIDPADPVNHEFASAIAHRMGTADAERDLEEAMRLNPWSARLREVRAERERLRGNFAEAIEWQRRAVALHPLQGAHHVRLARIHLEAGDAAAAQAALQQSREIRIFAPAVRAEREQLEQRLGLIPPD